MHYMNKNRLTEKRVLRSQKHYLDFILLIPITLLSEKNIEILFPKIFLM